jgi:hypothetical protein
MSRHGADEISGSAELPEMRPQVRCAMSADQRDRLLVVLAAKGWSHERISRYPGIALTRRGVGLALARIREGRPGRVRGE